MRYIQRWSDKPFEVASDEVTRWACCDCGLVHDIAFVARGDVIGVAARVNKRATAAKRRAGNSDVVTRAATAREGAAHASTGDERPPSPSALSPPSKIAGEG